MSVGVIKSSVPKSGKKSIHCQVPEFALAESVFKVNPVTDDGGYAPNTKMSAKAVDSSHDVLWYSLTILSCSRLRPRWQTHLQNF